MYLPILFYWIILTRISVLQTRRSPSCRSTYEPCESDCLLAVFRLNLRNALLFYTEHYLELRLDRLEISRFGRHSAPVSKLIADETCSLFSLMEMQILFRCSSSEFHLYTHQNRSVQLLSEHELDTVASETLNVFANDQRFVYQTPNYVIIFLLDGYFLCETKEAFRTGNKNCERYEASFLTAYHLKYTKSVFLLPDGIIYFGSDYFLLLRLNESANSNGDEPYWSADDDKNKRNVDDDPDENPDENEELPFTSPESFRHAGRAFTDETDQPLVDRKYTPPYHTPPYHSNYKQKDAFNLPVQEEHSSQTSAKYRTASPDIIQLLLKLISKERNSVRKFFYKDLFGCTAIRTRPDYRLPLHVNLVAYQRSQRSYLTHDPFRSAVTCYYWLVLFLLSFLLVTRLLNSDLIKQLEHSLYRENISDLDRLFIQLRTEIENGVLRKLEPTDLSRELTSRPSEMRILIDTLLHEQLFVNALNLDARRSVDLVRHLINEVCETIKLRRSDKSTERVAKKFKHLAL